jgi:HEAT repeat protein
MTTNLPNDVPKESPRTVLFQFVIFPLGVVMIGVAVFLLFGKLASNEQTIPDYLNDIRSGSSHRKFQAAYELSKSIKRGEAARYPNLVEQVVDVYRSSKSDDPRVRQYLTLVLGRLGDRRAVPVLIDGSSDQVVETRIYALIALAELHDSRAVPAMINATRDDDKDVRATAIYTLGEVRDPRALPVLQTALNDRVADIRFNAALSLSRYGDVHAEPVLRAMLDRTMLDHVPGMRPDQKEEAIVAAIPAYAKLAGKASLAELQPLADRDPSMRVRSAAKDAIANIQ